MADQQRLVLRAILVSAFSVVWSLLAGVTAVAVAVSTSSPSLAGFGLDALIDAAASLSLIWYFKARARNPSLAERREVLTTRVVGAALLAAAAYTAVRSILLLVDGVAPEASSLAVAISAVSVVVLPVLAAVKFRFAARIPSPALRSDAILTVGAALLAFVALLAASLHGVNGLWWIDPAAALVIAAVLAAEGIRAAVASTA
jgi:divalent metal cation (Fe/Co/Zn/Cd) transporter